MRIVVDDLESSAVQDLLRLHLDSMQDSSPPESVHALGLERLRSADVTVWSAWEGDDLLGIGALQADPGADEGEVKSMRTDPRHVGQGVGRTLLRTIIDAAREQGLARLSLETGSGAAFAAAHALYLSEGFEPCGPFGTYVDDPFSRFFTLDLGATG